MMYHERYLILGMGKSGHAVKTYCQRQGIDYVCVDRKQEEGVLSDQLTPQLEGITRLVKSPGIPLEHLWVQEAQKKGIPICTEIDLALPHLIDKTLIGVTGSNGKTTTVSALQQVLAPQAICVGNIGTPLLSVIDTGAPIVIVELSSFQLETLHLGPWFDYGILLNITKNHLDYHKTMERYAAAKYRLEKAIKPHGVFLTKKEIMHLEEKVETFFKERYRDGGVCLYAHDCSNFAAVWAVCRHLGMAEQEFGDKITHVKKPSHRLERVGVFGGVVVINDSKSTTIDATKSAIVAISAPQILVVGGINKGGDFREWRSLCAEKVRHLICFGKAAEEIEQIMQEYVSLIRVNTLSDALDQVKKIALPGQTLLFSPGCASFDQFLNFEDRGEKFKKLVKDQMGEGNEST